MEVGLDKAWHGLHFLFTGLGEGGPAPACYLLDGGVVIPMADTDAHVLKPSALADFRDYVHSVTEAELRTRYDPSRMAALHIYPEIIWERDPDESFDYVMEFHQQLWAFLRDAAEEKQGCVIWIG